MEKYINEIMKLSYESYHMDEIPVGAIVVENGKIIGYGINDRESKKSVLGHAEINAIKMACDYKKDWRLDGCCLYVTLFPCLMCLGTIMECRIKNVYYLCDKMNKCLPQINGINLIHIEDEKFEKEYLNLLQKFFKNKRK